MKITAVILGLMLSAGVARGQSYKVLHSFTLVPADANGALPGGDLIQATDGNIYGTTGALALLWYLRSL